MKKRTEKEVLETQSVWDQLLEYSIGDILEGLGLLDWVMKEIKKTVWSDLKTAKKVLKKLRKYDEIRRARQEQNLRTDQKSRRNRTKPKTT